MKKLLKVFFRRSLYMRILISLLLLMGSALMMILTTFNSHPIDQERLGIWQIPIQLENQFFDWRYKNYLEKKEKTISPHTILAAIDERSIMEIGRFPWSRKTWVDVVEKLGSFGAKVIAFDIIFSEEEVSCHDHPDRAFAQALSTFPPGPDNIIIGYAKTPHSSLAISKFPDILYHTLLESHQQSDQTYPPSFIKSSTFPISTLTERNIGLGFIDMQDDRDGVFRHYSVIANIISPEDMKEVGLSQFFPSFGLLSYMRYTNDSISAHVSQNSKNAWIKTKRGTLELDAYASTHLRYRGSEDYFSQVSILDIIQSPSSDPKMTELISGKVVFIASTAFAAHDFRNSPIQPKMPGVFFHMNLLDMLSEGRFFQPREKSLLISMIMLTISSILLFILQRWKITLLNFITTCALISGNYLLDTLYLLPMGMEIKLLSCLISLSLFYLWNAAINFYQVNKEKKEIRGTFSHYLSPSIVDEMLAHPEKLKMGGEKKDITVFFSDVRDFTSISEKLQPYQLTYCLNQYMNEMTSILFDYKGTLDKYIGDAIVAYWGAPIVLKNHPNLAVQASIKMIETLPEINEKFKSQGYPLFQVGIGINTGECSVGNMGSNQVFSYTAIGDNMNLGARLEGLCKFYGAQIIISEATLNRLNPNLKQKIIFRHLDLVKVKGKEQSVHIYEILASYHPLYQHPKDVSLYHQAWDCLQKQKFSETIQLCQAFLSQHPKDQACNHLLTQGKIYLKNPPKENWDGARIMDSK